MDIDYKNIDNNQSFRADSETESQEDAGYPVNVYFYELNKLYRHEITWHWHQEIEVIIVNNGTIAVSTNDTRLELSAGEGVFINFNVMHEIKSATLDPNCSFYSLVFHPSFLFGHSDLTLGGKYIAPVLGSKHFQVMPLNEKNKDEAELINDVNEIIALNLIKAFGYELKTKAYLCSFWALLASIIVPHLKKSNFKSGSRDEIRTKEMIKYIEEHYSEKIALEELADYVHISKSECCRCFKRVLGITPVEYILRFRIYTAANFIKVHDKRADSFSELAFSVGFNNASYFNKIFREYLECTPSEYKKRVDFDPNYSIQEPKSI